MDPETFVFSYEEDTSKRFHLNFFTPGFSYKLMGLVPIRTHFLGVEAPGTIFLLGTDAHGRDLLSRILYGGRISLSVALLGALVAGIVGTTIGSISGYYSGIIDVLLQRLVELVQCFPQLALWMVLSMAFPFYMATFIYSLRYRWYFFIVILAFISSRNTREGIILSKYRIRFSS